MTVRPGDTFLYSFPTEKKALHVFLGELYFTDGMEKN